MLLLGNLQFTDDKARDVSTHVSNPLRPEGIIFCSLPDSLMEERTIPPSIAPQDDWRNQLQPDGKHNQTREWIEGIRELSKGTWVDPEKM